jgi:hypothetical protein
MTDKRMMTRNEWAQYFNARIECKKAGDPNGMMPKLYREVRARTEAAGYAELFPYLEDCLSSDIDLIEISGLRVGVAQKSVS